MSPSISPYQKIFLHPIFRLMWCLSLSFPDSLSRLYFIFLCLLCCTAADLHTAKYDIATKVEGLCKVGVKLQGKGELSSLYAPAINQPIKNWPLRAWLRLFINAHPTQSDAYIILLMTGSKAKLINEHSPHARRELVWGEVREKDQSI